MNEHGVLLRRALAHDERTILRRRQPCRLRDCSGVFPEEHLDIIDRVVFASVNRGVCGDVVDHLASFRTERSEASREMSRGEGS